MIQQVRALQVLETLKLCVCGYPHKVRLRSFCQRYRPLAGGGWRGRDEREDEGRLAECRTVLARCRHRLEAAAAGGRRAWALGPRHVFLSEQARQVLEGMLVDRQEAAARTVQQAWLGWRRAGRRRRPHPHRPPPPPLNGAGQHRVPPLNAASAGSPLSSCSASSDKQQHHDRDNVKIVTVSNSPKEESNLKAVHVTCSLFGLDMVRIQCGSIE